MVTQGKDLCALKGLWDPREDDDDVEWEEEENLMSFNIQRLATETKQAGPPGGGQPEKVRPGVARSVMGRHMPSPLVFRKRGPLGHRSAEFDFLDHMVSVTAPQTCCQDMTAAADHT